METLKITYRDIGRLSPYARNARTHSEQQVQQIADSIKEFGFTNPVLIDEDGEIIAGHGRVLASELLGMKKVPCIVLDNLSERQKRAYVLADNKIALNSGWNFELLAEEMSYLSETDFDLTLTGFNEQEIDALLKDDAGILPEGSMEGEQVQVAAHTRNIKQGKTDDDAVPNVPQVVVSKLGDVWILGSHRVMCGDSTSLQDMNLLMHNELADMLFTDPPYGVSYQGGHNLKKRDQIKNDNLNGEMLTDLFQVSLSIACDFTADHAAFYVWFASGKSVETFAAFSKLPLKLRAVIQWYKIHSGLGAFMSQYIPNCEPCIYAFKNGKSPQWYGPTDEKTVWELKKEPRNDYHPTQKPVELAVRAVVNSSENQQIVLDIFGGSGSTLIACEKTNRKARLMELDPKYVDVIVRRWQEFTGQQARLEATNETFEELEARRG